MRKSISEALNTIKIKQIDSIEIDHKNNKVEIKLQDWKKKSYNLELYGVDNYHFIDDYIYVKEDQKNMHRGVSFYDSMPWAYMTLTYDDEGNVVDSAEIAPNFVANSKDKSLCLKVGGAKLNGNFYPVFKNSFLSDSVDGGSDESKGN